MLVLALIKSWLTPKVRAYLYSVSIAALPVLIYFGVLDHEAAALIVPLVVAVLYVPRKGIDLRNLDGE